MNRSCRRHSQVSGKVPVFLETPKINGTHDYHYGNCWLRQRQASESSGLPAAPACTTSVITRKRFKLFQSKQDLEVQGAGGSSGLEIIGCHGRAGKDLLTAKGKARVRFSPSLLQ